MISIIFCTIKSIAIIPIATIYVTKEYSYHNLRGVIQIKDIVVVKGDKDSSAVIRKKSDYLTKLDTMVNGGIMKGTSVEINDNT